MNKIRLLIPVTVFKKTDNWVAYCPVLKTFGYSKESSEGALKDFDDAISTFFYVQDKLGKLDETLRSLGWNHSSDLKPHLTMPKIPTYYPEKRYRASNKANTVEREILMPA